MQISLLLMEQISELFLMIFMGYIIVKIGILKDTDSTVISKIVLYIINPSVIISAFQVEFTKDRVKDLLVAFAASLALQILLLFIVWFMKKILKLTEVEEMSIYYSNAGNLIVPIVTYVFGKDWVLYACAFMSVQLCFLWSHCKIKLSREKRPDLKKIILNINMISIFTGIVLFFTRIRFPGIINGTLSAVGGMIGPASMIVTGMLIAGMNLKDVFLNKRVYFITFLRLIIVPIIALFLIKILGFSNLSANGEKLLLIVYLAIITPSASTVTQMCQVYGNDARTASSINVMTTIFSILTMPVLVYLFQMIV